MRLKIYNNYLSIAILEAIFFLAFSVRIYKLGLLPINHDEAVWSLSFAQRYSCPVFVQPFEGPVFLSLALLAKSFFYSIVAIARLPAVIIGSLTVVLIYKLAERMYGIRTAWASALLLCFLPWHVIQSRLGYSVILVPFFGCLIFYALIRAVQDKSRIWFWSSCLFLGLGSFYTCQSGVLFVPLFLLVLFILRKDVVLFGRHAVWVGGMIFFATIIPVIYLQITGKIDFIGDFYNGEHAAILEGNIFFNFIKNLQNNAVPAVMSLFSVMKPSRFLYGQALDAPLLVSPAAAFIVLSSVLFSLRQNKAADKIILSWLGISIFVLAGVIFLNARYIIIILPAFIILIAKFFAEFFKPDRKDIIFKGLRAVAGGVFAALILGEIIQTANYYIRAPVDLEECRNNSYGCAEAARYLSGMPDLKDCRIVADNRMTVNAYLDYYLREGNNSSGWHNISKKTAYYVVWAAETHPRDFWNGSFSWLYTAFRQQHPDAAPVKTVYYPDGQPAIKIFKTAGGGIF